MKTIRRWYELLLPGMTVILVLVLGNIQTANAQYAYIQGDWEGYEDYNHTPNSKGSTWEESAYAYSYANEGTGVCNCRTDADVKAKDDYAVADADAYALLTIDWTWSGPPEYAPGGDLTWIHDASGSSTAAWGYNTATAVSSSRASAGSWTGGTAGSAYADVEVEGSIEDGQTIEGEADWDADPYGEFDEGTVTEDDTPPWYEFAVDGWSFSTGDEEAIAAGTTYIQFYGGIDCEALAAITNEATTYWSEAHGEAVAEIEVDADFDY